MINFETRGIRKCLAMQVLKPSNKSKDGNKSGRK